MLQKTDIPAVEIICPLCREINEDFHSQRCTHCGMLMMSDQAYHIVESKIKPIIIEIKAKSTTENNWQQIQPLLEQLAPYQQDFQFVQNFLQHVSKKIQPYVLYDKLQIMWYLNIFIAVILFFMPIGAWLLGSSLMVVGLLLMPAVGWLWFGLYLFNQKRKRAKARLTQ